MPARLWLAPRLLPPRPHSVCVCVTGFGQRAGERRSLAQLNLLSSINPQPPPSDRADRAALGHSLAAAAAAKTSILLSHSQRALDTHLIRRIVDQPSERQDDAETSKTTLRQASRHSKLATCRSTLKFCIQLAPIFACILQQQQSPPKPTLTAQKLTIKSS